MDWFINNILKKKYICLYIVSWCALLCVCIAMAVASRSLLVVEGNKVFSHEDVGETLIYENISLTPGVYEIYLQYHTDKDYSAYCSINDDTVPEKAFLTNGDHIYAGLGQTDFCLWLLKPAHCLRVVVDYGGDSYLETGNLLIRNTGKLWSILFVTLFVIGIGIILICMLWTCHKQQGIAFQTLVLWGMLFCIGLIASGPQLGGYMYGGADLTYHLQRIEGVKDSLLAGQFPIRIEPEWLYGHGYANGIFYCDVLFYLPALLRIAGFTVTTSYNVYCIVLNFVTAWIAWYCFQKIFDDKWIGLMCSAIYTLSAMRICRLVMVAAVGEGSAITFLPLVFYGIYAAFCREQRAWVALAIGYAGVIQTHPLTCEITALVTVVICLICVKKLLDRKVLELLVKGVVSAVGLSFWYLVPFLDYYFTQDMHIRHVSGRTIQERGLFWKQLFVNAWTDRAWQWLEAQGTENILPISPGWVCLAAIMVFCVFAVLYRYKEDEKTRRILRAGIVSVVVSCLLLYMTLRVFPWNWIQERGSVAAALVSSLQFPYRFMGWAMVFLTLLVGCCIYLIPRRKLAYMVGGIVTVFHIVTVAGVLLWGIMNETDHHLYIYSEGAMGYGYISGAEYLIQGTDENKLSFAGAVTGAEVEITEYQKKYLGVKMTCGNSGDVESYVDLPLLNYKGYQATSDRGEDLQVGDGENHQVRVLLPPGFSGSIQVKFISPFYWRLSELVTVITGMLIVGNLTKKQKHGTLRKVKRE